MPSTPLSLIQNLDLPKSVTNAHDITDPIRWAILQELDKPRAPREIALKLGVKTGMVVYHLKRLQELGVVETTDPVREEGARGKAPLAWRRKNFTAAIVVTPTSILVREE